MPIDVSAAIPTFLITLREGVEAALVVGIVMAYLNKAGQSRLYAWVYGGIGAGVLGSGLLGALFVGILQVLASSDRVYAPVVKLLLEAGLGVIAIGLLSWMLIWMTQQAKTLKSQVESELGAVLQTETGAAWGIFSLIFFAVLREGFETVVFIAAKFQQGWIPALGAALGLVGAVVIGMLLFKLGIKINLRLFFQAMGTALLLIVGGLVISVLVHLDRALLNLQTLEPAFASLCSTPLSDANTCFLGAQVWDWSAILPDRRFPGIILHTLLGYVDRLYAVEAIAYGLFLLTIGGLYFRALRGSSRKAAEVSVSEG